MSINYEREKYKMTEKVMRKHMEERFGKVFNYSLNPPLPASLNVELNNTCNQKCVFCGYHGRYGIHKLRPAVLELDFVKKILDQAKMLGIGNKEVGFYLAGEAFLYKELAEVIRYAKTLEFPYTFLTTNGALAGKERMEEVVNAGLDSIRFSVNAGDRETYKEIHGVDDFERVLENIKYLDQYRKKNNINIAVSISCVVTKKTKFVQNDIERIFAPYVDDILFIPVRLSRLKKLQVLKDEFEMIDDSGEIDFDYVCPVLFDTMYISSEGKVIPCCSAYDTGVEFADLYENFDLKKAWYSENYDKYRKIFVDGASDNETICKTCTLRHKGAGKLSME